MKTECRTYVPNKYGNDIDEEGEDSRKAGKHSRKGKLEKIRERMEYALGHDNFQINEVDFDREAETENVDVDIDIFFTDKVLEKRFIFRNSRLVGVKDRRLAEEK